MDVRLLEAFRAVVDHRSVTDAAAAHGRHAAGRQRADRPPRARARLLAVRARGSGRLKPTPEGMLFYAEASKALTGSIG